MPLAKGSDHSTISKNVAEMMRSGYPQRRAVAAALRTARGREDGGATPAAVAPTPANQNPMAQQQYQYFQAMSPEQLQEAVLRLGASPMAQIAQRILQQKRTQTAQQPDTSGPPQTYALGGEIGKVGPNASRGTFSERAGIHMPGTSSGFLHTAGPGRTDNLHIKPVSNSYVLPSDVVSGSGQGNSLSGSKAIQAAISTFPHGVSATSVGHRFGAPKPPHIGAPMAKGGKPNVANIIAAGGEEVLSPEQVEAIGRYFGGDKHPDGAIAHGHSILDKLVLHVRGRTIKELKGLRGPIKS